MDSQVQDALVQISSLSNRLQRERAVAAAAAANSLNPQSNVTSPTQPQMDNYLEYLDDAEPNASELDDMIDDEPSNQQHYAHSTLVNDIKSECDDNVDEDDNVERPLDEDDHDVDDTDMRNFVLNSLEKRQQQQQRLQHLQRLQSRAFYEDFRNKRSRSHENISSSQSSTSSLLTSSNHHLNNVSFVRPTFAKPLEVVSTTTQNLNNTNASSNNSNNSNSSSTSSTHTNDSDSVSNTTARYSSSNHNQNHNSNSHYSTSVNQLQAHHQRFEISAVNSGASNSSLNALASQTSAGGVSASSLVVPAASTPELCDCKTDPDAMFLMSLLPDIQKLNGRDRGKIKIAFQNILQDYLYPD